MEMKTDFRTENTDDFIKWSEKYKIGVPVVDAQHEQLVRLCNNFYKSILNNRDTQDYRTTVKQTLEKCLSYAITHFREEERLMKAAAFSGLQAHKAAHDSFAKKCAEHYEHIASLTISEALKFAYFLRDWILTHIAYEDRLYLPDLVNFLKENQSSDQ